MKRNDYIAYNDDINTRDKYYRSTKNEPWWTDKLSYYPDMGKTYDSFSDIFQISKENFILTNGCENALRIMLEYSKCHNLIIEKPGWQMTEVLGNALRYNVSYNEFVFDKNSKEFYLDINYNSILESSLMYTTDTYNNLFKHRNINIEKIIDNNAELIIDETYTMKSLREHKAPEKNFVIGSFSKFFGAGYRLGYILFPKQHNNSIQMLREQYINSEACKLLSCKEYIEANLNRIATLESEKNTDQNIVTAHPVYKTFILDNIDIPHKKFQVSNINFCRIGRNCIS